MFRKCLLAAVAAVGLYSAPVYAQAVPPAGEWVQRFFFWDTGSLITGGVHRLCVSNDVGTTVSGSWISMDVPAWSGRWRYNRDVWTLIGKQSYYTTISVVELQTPTTVFGHFAHFFTNDTAPNSNGNVSLTKISRFCDKSAMASIAATPNKDPAR